MTLDGAVKALANNTPQRRPDPRARETAALRWHPDTGCNYCAYCSDIAMTRFKADIRGCEYFSPEAPTMPVRVRDAARTAGSGVRS